MDLVKLDKELVWHPFTQMKGAKIVPIVKGEGVRLIDENGNSYIDAVSSWWVKIHGHAHPYIGDEMAAQFKELDHVIFAGFTHPKAVEAAVRLTGHLPAGIQKVFYSDNGSTSCEVGLKMALQYWYNQGLPKTRIIAFEGAYHGDTFGSMSVSARTSFSDPFKENLFEVDYIPTPTNGNIEEILNKLDDILQSNEVGAFIYEPLVQGVRGMVMYDSAHLDRILAKVKAKNVLCIADEVMTGFHKTGTMFASDQMENEPDIICLSKALTGGVMALGVTAATNEVYNAFYDDDRTKTFLHGHSFTGNPLACAAVCASLDLLESNETQLNLNWLKEQHKAFETSIAQHDAVLEVRRKGVILAIELRVDENSGYYSDLGPKAYQFFMDKGIVMRPLGNVLILMPPYCINEKDLNYIYMQIRSFLNVLND